MTTEADNTATSVSLVLGSGGARGHAHIGVIRALEENGLEVRNIAGTSIGAVIGGVYAAGELDTYFEWANSLSGGDIVRLLDLSLSRKALFKGERVFEALRELIGDRDIEDLERGFTAVCTDIDAHNEVWLQVGSLFSAVRASAAVPGVFDPLEIDGRTLVDGGLINPIPIAPTLNDSTDLTIAVNLNSISSRYENPDPRDESDNEAEVNGFGERIANFVAGIADSEASADEQPGAAELLTRSIDVMQGAIARLKLAAYAPDHVVEIPRDACTFFEFDRSAEMAELGYKKTSEILRGLNLQ
jgi:NTE family protein